MVRKKLLTKKEKHIGKYFDSARTRAKKKGLPFTITLEYLRSIAEDKCPIFHTDFSWGISGLGRGKFKDNSPQLDRIIPELGYVIGNVAFISHRANRIKDNGTMQEHYDIADWIWDRTVAKTKKASASFISKRDRVALDVHTEYGSVPRARPWEDSDNINHNRRTIPRDDIGDRTKASSRDRLADRDAKMGTLEALKSLQNFGIALSAAVSPEPTRSHFLSELRERGLVDGTEPEV